MHYKEYELSSVSFVFSFSENYHPLCSLKEHATVKKERKCPLIPIAAHDLH